MNLKNKLKSIQKDPELMAVAGFLALFMLFVCYKLGVLVGHFLYQLPGK